MDNYWRCRDQGFKKYVELFDEPGYSTKAEQLVDPNASSIKGDTLQSSCSTDSDWFMVSATDPLSSLTSTVVPSSDDSIGCGNTMAESSGNRPRRKLSLDNVDRLCGYLNKYKIGARNVTRAFKRRWFVHADNSCKLLYYRTANDQIPLGEIDVAHATLSIYTCSGTTSHTFEIRYGSAVVKKF